MDNYAELIERLVTRLGDFGYTNDEKIAVPNIVSIMYVNKTSILKTKNLCAVIDMPNNLKDVLTTKRFFKFIKDSLLEQYGDAFLWKELEMCFVVLCGNDLYAILNGNEERTVSEASFSLNALLVTCFVNRDNFDRKTISTWGIYFSGEHFKTVDQIVSEWCEKQKVQQNNPLS